MSKYCEHLDEDNCELTECICNPYDNHEDCIYKKIYEAGYCHGFFDGENGRTKQY